MHKAEMRRFLSVMEFFYGFLFGVAIFGATLTFIVTTNFFLAILLSVCVFAFFAFLTALTRYCIARVRLADENLCATLQNQQLQIQILQTMQQQNLNTNQDGNIKNN